MSLETYSDAIQTSVDALVPAALSTADFLLPNRRGNPTVGTPWVTYTIQTFDNLNVSSGWRWNEGIIEFQCFVPLESGIDDAAALAEEVGGALRDQVFSGGYYRNVRLVEVGEDDAGWWQYNVQVEFYHQETA